MIKAEALGLGTKWRSAFAWDRPVCGGQCYDSNVVSFAESRTGAHLPPGQSAIVTALRQLKHTIGEVRQFPQL